MKAERILEIKISEFEQELQMQASSTECKIWKRESQASNKESVKTKILLTPCIQKIWDTMKRQNPRIIEGKEGEES